MHWYSRKVDVRKYIASIIQSVILQKYESILHVVHLKDCEKPYVKFYMKTGLHDEAEKSFLSGW